MFDIGFIEIMLIAVVSLLVLGPDKLPGAIRTAGLWIGRLKRSFNNIRTEIEREVGADEIRRQLRNEAIMEKIKNTRSQVTQSIDSVKDEVKSVSESANIKKEVDGLNRTINPTAAGGSDTGQQKDSSTTTGTDTAAGVADKSRDSGQDSPAAQGQQDESSPREGADQHKSEGGNAPSPSGPQSDPGAAGSNTPDNTDDKQHS